LPPIRATRSSVDHGLAVAPKSSSTAAKASGSSFTTPAKGSSTAVTTSRPEKIRNDRTPRHHRLNAQVLGTKEEGEADRQSSTTKEHKPDHSGNDAWSQDKPDAAGLGHNIELVESLSQQGRPAG